MALQITFNEINPNPYRVEEGLQISVTQGNLNAAIIRTSLADNVDGDNLIYDSISSKVFKRPNKLIVVKGAIKTKMYWEEADNIQASDIDRMKALNANDKIKLGTWTESTTSDAVANKEYLTTYQFGSDYNELSDMSGQWNLATSGILEATQDDTRLFCVVSDGAEYNIKIIDIPFRETKTLAKQQTTNYVFFSQNCSIGETNIKENAVKKLNSSSIDVTNQSNMTARVIIVSR